jgi:hypothetical protein
MDFSFLENEQYRTRAQFASKKIKLSDGERAVGLVLMV